LPEKKFEGGGFLYKKGASENWGKRSGATKTKKRENLHLKGKEGTPEEKNPVY